MLDPGFFQQPTLELAQELLGRDLVRHLDGVRLVGRIVEVEAYHQDGDAAAHSFNGPTQRNRVMFGPPGFLYVYFIYGVHYCMNVVSEAQGVGAAVLIRGLEPLEGIEQMRSLRGPKAKDANLTNGPAKSCQAFGIDRNQDGVCLNGPQIYLEAGQPATRSQIVSTTRIGISKSVDLPWRFHISGNAHVSKK